MEPAWERMNCAPRICTLRGMGARPTKRDRRTANKRAEIAAVGAQVVEGDAVVRLEPETRASTQSGNGEG
jgi:hypothetical protein